LLLLFADAFLFHASFPRLRYSLGAMNHHATCQQQATNRYHNMYGQEEAHT